MLSFITDNIATIIVGAIVAVWLVIAVVKMASDRKKGGSCGSCPYSETCHRRQENCKKP